MIPLPTLALLTLLALPAPLAATALEVNITRDLGEFTVQHGTREVRVMRNQETDNVIDFDYALTSRPCPPFCAQPMRAAPGVETIGEVELVAFMRTRLADGSGVLIDARTPDWFERGLVFNWSPIPTPALSGSGSRGSSARTSQARRPPPRKAAAT